MVKYPFWVQKNYYIIRYNVRAAAILTFEKFLYLRGRLRLTTARRLSAYMSSRALATTTTSSSKSFASFVKLLKILELITIKRSLLFLKALN